MSPNMVILTKLEIPGTIKMQNTISGPHPAVQQNE
jgi:hypothetical protein